MNYTVYPFTQEEDYDHYLKQFSHYSLLQTPIWGKFKSDQSTWTSEVLKVVDEHQKMVASLMVLYRRIPLIRQQLAYAPRGINTDFTNKEQLKGITQALTNYFKEKRVFNFKIDPELDIHSKTGQQAKDHLEAAQFQQKTFDLGFSGIQFHTTVHINLPKQPDELYDQLPKKVQYEIRRAKKLGVTYFKGTIDDFKHYDMLNQLTAKRTHYIARHIDYLKAMYEYLHPLELMDIYFAKIDYSVLHDYTVQQLHNTQHEIKRLTSLMDKSDSQKRLTKLHRQLKEQQTLLQKYTTEIPELEDKRIQYPDGQILSGAIIANYGSKAYYMYAANSTEYSQLNANRYLQYCIMKTLIHEKKITQYDLFGILPNTDDSSIAGINLFKESFGADPVTYIGEYDLIIKPFWQKLFYSYAPRFIAFRKHLLQVFR